MDRRYLLVAMPAALLASCGFELRRAPELRFATLALSGFQPRSPIAEELRRLVASSTTTRIVETPTQAQAVLESLSDAHQRSVVASTAAGLVREVELRVRLRFRLITPQGRELIPPTELSAERDMTYNETAALAKEREQEFLYRAMDAEIAQQVMWRLAAAPTP